MTLLSHCLKLFFPIKLGTFFFFLPSQKIIKWIHCHIKEECGFSICYYYYYYISIIITIAMASRNPHKL